MSESHVEVVQVKDVRPHPNADTLDICTIHEGYPVIFKRGYFKEGDLAVYFPVDSTFPQDEQQWEFLGKQRRVRAKKLRGVFSMGLLATNSSFHALGEDVRDFYGVRRWEDVQAEQGAYRGASQTDGLEVPAPDCALPGVYDLEGYRKFGKQWFADPDERVVITEKIHGQNLRAVYWNGKLHVGSRTRWLAYGDPERESTWSRVAKRYALEAKLSAMPGIVVFGESYGNNADMPYGVKRHETGDALVVFDMWDPFALWGFHAYDDLRERCAALELPMAPELYVGPLPPDAVLLHLAEGNTTLGGNHVREGWVMRPLRRERYATEEVRDRSILKMHGQGYLTRKGG
jgi:RNA ligase (TIGR02306 family)